MTPSLRSHIADVLQGGVAGANNAAIWGLAPFLAEEFADALLASPELAAIIDLAAWAVKPDDPLPLWSTEVHGLLAAWRASRAEQEPTPPREAQS